MSFVKEYCQARKIPYKIQGEGICIGDMKTYEGTFSIFSVYNFTYNQLINTIDKYIDYDKFERYICVNKERNMED